MTRECRRQDHIQVSPPDGWTVGDEADEQVAVVHDERDVEVIVESFDLSGDAERSRGETAAAGTVFEVGYRPADVEANSIHVSTVDSAEQAERLIRQAIDALDE